jgi:uncharacterized membrane protein SpoIIM required for sporulation
MNIGRTKLLGEAGLLSEESLYHMKYMTVDKNALFWYVAGMRLKKVVILAVLATTYLGLAAVCAAIIGCGVTAGMFLSAAFLQYGAKGLLLVLASVFPQFLLYVPALFFLFKWCEQICRGIYFEKNLRLAGRNALLAKLMQLLGIVAVAITGCVLESYVNPILVKKLLKIF